MIGIVLLAVLGWLYVKYLNPDFKIGDFSKISPEKAVEMIAQKYHFEKSLVKFGGIDPKTGYLEINLSPGKSKSPAGRTFYVNPMNGKIIDPFVEPLKKLK